MRKLLCESSHAANTWEPVFSALTPSLTRLREMLDAEEAMEETESWLPLRSRDRLLRPRPTLLTLPRLTGVAITGVVSPSILATLCMGANSPYSGRHSKYLKKNTKTFCNLPILMSTKNVSPGIEQINLISEEI